MRRMLSPQTALLNLTSIAILLGTPAIASAQSDSAKRKPAQSWEDRLSDPIYMSWMRSDTTRECVDCHLSPSVGSSLRGKDKNPFGTFSRRTEMERWLTTDKHTIARRRVEPFAKDQAEQQLENLFDTMADQQDGSIEALTEIGIPIDRSKIGLTEVPRDWIGQSNVLSRRICDKLWGNGSVTTPEGYNQFRDNCLTCHGGYEAGKPGFDLADLTNASKDSQLGIDCNYCHQIGDNTRWVNAHREVKKWRLADPAAKAGAGMRHLVDTSNQASMCFDCHIGNRSKNMFVTHEMYAAGHPPIPSIELQQFCQEMPQHWQTPSKLHQSLEKYKGRDQYFATNYPGLTTQGVTADKMYWSTRKMLIGALVARAKALDLYIESAAVNPATGAHQWADYSLYDCAACHHELQSDSVRQNRYITSDSKTWNPGRPRENEWPDALLTIGYQFLAYAEGSSATKQAITGSQQQLTDLFSAQPFGNPDQVGPTAEQMRDQIKTAIEIIERKPVDARIARQMLLGLSRTPSHRMLTYDSARQVVWAIQTIAAELKAEGEPIDAQTQAIVDSLGDPAVTGIESKIPAGRQQFIYRDALDADLKRRSAFDPATLKAKLTQVGSQLAGTTSRSTTNLTSKQ